MGDVMAIGELADAAGISRRAVRFYVQRGLLTSPNGAGRGRHYDASHLERLRRIQELQTAGYSLDAIGRILEGAPIHSERAAPVRPRPALTAELWTRIKIAEGIELHIDAGRHDLSSDALLAAREALQKVIERQATKGAGHGPGHLI